MHHIIVWTIGFGVASLGNCLLVIAFIKSHLSRKGTRSILSTPSYLLIFLQCLSETIFCIYVIFICTFILTHDGLSQYRALCLLSGFFNHWYSAISILLIALMAHERYKTIFEGPDSIRIKTIMYYIAGIVTFSTVYACLPFMGQGQYDRHGYSESCYAQGRVDTITLSSVCFVLVSAAYTSLAYWRIFQYIRTIREQVQQTRGVIDLNVEMAIIKSYVATIFSFSAAWSPVIVVWILEISDVPVPVWYEPFALLCTTIYFLAHPILYFLLNSTIRQSVYDLLQLQQPEHRGTVIAVAHPKYEFKASSVNASKIIPTTQYGHTHFPPSQYAPLKS